MNDEQRYTLSEAKLELNKAECAQRGHQFRIYEHGGGEPLALVCDRCGRSWPVGTEEKPRGVAT